MLINSLVVAAAASLGLAAAETLVITVGYENSLQIYQDSLSAKVGDILQFQFFPGGHSVARGNYSSACRPATSGGFYSGVIKADKASTPSQGPVNTTFSYTVIDTEPIFFYCAEGNHCAQGMYGVVNPSEFETSQGYGDMAAAYGGNGVSPPSVFGGVLGTLPPSADTTPTPATSSVPEHAPSPSTTMSNSRSAGPSTPSASSQSSPPDMDGAGWMPKPSLVGLLFAVGMAMMSALMMA